MNICFFFDKFCAFKLLRGHNAYPFSPHKFFSTMGLLFTKGDGSYKRTLHNFDAVSRLVFFAQCTWLLYCCSIYIMDPVDPRGSRAKRKTITRIRQSIKYRCYRWQCALIVQRNYIRCCCDCQLAEQLIAAATRSIYVLLCK